MSAVSYNEALYRVVEKWSIKLQVQFCTKIKYENVYFSWMVCDLY